MLKLYPRPVKSVGVGPRHNFRSSLVSQCSDTAEDPSHPDLVAQVAQNSSRDLVDPSSWNAAEHGPSGDPPSATRWALPGDLASACRPWFWEGSLWDAVFVYLSEKRTRPWGRSSDR